MSMRHHWHELDELLAQIDQEARFKRGPFRPGLKALRPLEDVAAQAASPDADVAPVAAAKPSVEQ